MAFGLSVALTLGLLACALIPSVREHSRLVTTIVSVGAALLVWQAVLLVVAQRRARPLRLELVPLVKAHYIQASVQSCIYVYWGWHWREVYAEIPQFVAQLLFIYVFDALFAWSRGRSWRLGCGPLPIILSTNVFIWFKDDWFIFQFLMIATAVLGKELLKWQRDGKRVHIFNPSAFSLALFSVALLATGRTDLTHGVQIATTLYRPDYIYLEIFLLGLIVQYFFATTLMTLSAAGVLCLLNLVYTGATGVYHFVDANIPIAVFLGFHLLVTDPKTSPRTNAGRVIFGSLYGLAIWISYGVLGDFGMPQFYDKLLPIPILNLCVRLIDHAAESGLVSRFTRWERSFQQRKLNLVHMGCWAGLFATMWTTGFVEGRHEGSSIDFWIKAFEERKPRAAEKLLTKLELRATGTSSGAGRACNRLGTFYMEGGLLKEDHTRAALFFTRACELGDVEGCENVAKQFLYLRELLSDADVARALERLEAECGRGTSGPSCFLVGTAYETGRGRHMDPEHALELYRQGCRLGDLDSAKSLVRLTLAGGGNPLELADAARVLGAACETGEAESCLYLAGLFNDGNGVQRDEARARALLERACQLGLAQACRTLERLGH